MASAPSSARCAGAVADAGMACPRLYRRCRRLSAGDRLCPRADPGAGRRRAADDRPQRRGLLHPAGDDRLPRRPARDALAHARRAVGLHRHGPDRLPLLGWLADRIGAPTRRRSPVGSACWRSHRPSRSGGGSDRYSSFTPTRLISACHLAVSSLQQSGEFGRAVEHDLRAVAVQRARETPDPSGASTRIA